MCPCLDIGVCNEIGALYAASIEVADAMRICSTGSVDITSTSQRELHRWLKRREERERKKGALIKDRRLSLTL